jgi:hypothetical protein
MSNLGRAYVFVLLVEALILLFLASGCSHTGAVKIHFSRPGKGGLSRQGKVIPYSETDGYVCISRSDLELLTMEAPERLGTETQ